MAAKGTKQQGPKVDARKTNEPGNSKQLKRNSTKQQPEKKENRGGGKKEKGNRERDGDRQCDDVKKTPVVEECEVKVEDEIKREAPPTSSRADSRGGRTGSSKWRGGPLNVNSNSRSSRPRGPAQQVPKQHLQPRRGPQHPSHEQGGRELVGHENGPLPDWEGSGGPEDNYDFMGAAELVYQYQQLQIQPQAQPVYQQMPLVPFPQPMVYNVGCMSPVSPSPVMQPFLQPLPMQPQAAVWQPPIYSAGLILHQQVTPCGFDDDAYMPPLPHSPMFVNRPPTYEGLKEAVRHQIEFYLSEENLEHDDYIRSAMDVEGFISLVEISKFRRIKLYFFGEIDTRALCIMVETIRESTKLELNEAEDRVRPKENPLRWPVPPKNTQTVEAMSETVTTVPSEDEFPSLPGKDEKKTTEHVPLTPQSMCSEVPDSSIWALKAKQRAEKSKRGEDGAESVGGESDEVTARAATPASSSHSLGAATAGSEWPSTSQQY